MPKIHDVKCWTAPFQATKRGEKTHEVRKDDRGYGVDDVLRLHEWDPRHEMYTGDTIERLVTHKTPGGAFGLPTDLCVMSVKSFEWIPKVCANCGCGFKSQREEFDTCNDCL